MTREKMLVMRIASHLLQYPNGEMMESLNLFSDWISELHAGPAKEVFADFLIDLKNRRLLDLQEEYSRIFDLSAATCLNLSYHKYGDERERGAALARLSGVYREAGYETTARELPDFLPLVLEFLSVCSGQEYAWIIEEYRPQIETLSARLKENGSPYAALLRVCLYPI